MLTNIFVCLSVCMYVLQDFKSLNVHVIFYYCIYAHVDEDKIILLSQQDIKFSYPTLRGFPFFLFLCTHAHTHAQKHTHTKARVKIEYI